MALQESLLSLWKTLIIHPFSSKFIGLEVYVYLLASQIIYVTASAACVSFWPHILVLHENICIVKHVRKE